MMLKRLGLTRLTTWARDLPQEREVPIEIGLSNSHAIPTKIHHPHVLGCSGIESLSIDFLATGRNALRDSIAHVRFTETFRVRDG